MPDKGFGSDLWKNLQAVKLGQDGGIEAPVRANGRDGIVAGVDQVAAADAASQGVDPARESPKRRWWTRLLRH